MGFAGGHKTHQRIKGSLKKLIAAVVACYEEDDLPPPDLSRAWACERWHCLPDAGGYHDQDFATMQRMTVCSNVYNTLSRWHNFTGARIHNLTDNDRKILRYLKDMGLMFV